MLKVVRKQSESLEGLIARFVRKVQTEKILQEFRWAQLNPKAKKKMAKSNKRHGKPKKG